MSTQSSPQSVPELTPAQVEHPEQQNPTADQHYLKIAREQLKLSHVDVAHELNLMVSQIEKIEANNFNEFAPIFAKGYVRSYAKLVNLPKDKTEAIISSIIDPEQQLNYRGKYKSPHKKSHKLCSSKIKAEHGNSKTWPKLLIYLIIIILLIFFVNYWQHAHHKPETQSTNTTQPSQILLANNDNLDDDLDDDLTLDISSLSEPEIIANTEDTQNQENQNDPQTLSS